MPSSRAWRAGDRARGRRRRGRSGAGRRGRLRHVDHAAAQRRERADHVVVALLPDEAPGRQDHVLGRRRVRRGRGGEALDVDARRGDLDALGGHALEQQRRAGALGRGEEQVAVGEHELPVPPRRAVPEGVEQRQRLPHGLHEAERAARAAALRRPRRRTSTPSSSRGRRRPTRTPPRRRGSGRPRPRRRGRRPARPGGSRAATALGRARARRSPRRSGWTRSSGAGPRRRPTAAPTGAAPTAWPGGRGRAGPSSRRPRAVVLASVPSAVARHVNRRARSTPASACRRASPGSFSRPRIAPAMSSTLCGSNSTAASPATSGSEDSSPHATGTPRRMPSSTGSPKPSASDGNATQAARR